MDREQARAARWNDGRKAIEQARDMARGTSEATIDNLLDAATFKYEIQGPTEWNTYNLLVVSLASAMVRRGGKTARGFEV